MELTGDAHSVFRFMQITAMSPGKSPRSCQALMRRMADLSDWLSFGGILSQCAWPLS